MAIRRRCLAPLPFMTGFYVAAGFTFQQILFVSADLQSAMLCVTEFMQSADCRRRRSSPSGSRNHRTTLLVAAVRKSASEVPLRACSCKRNFKDAQPPFHRMLRIVRSQPRTASLLSGNSVLLADFFRRRLTPSRQLSVFQRFCAGLARGEPSAMLPGRAPCRYFQITPLPSISPSGAYHTANCPGVMLRCGRSKRMNRPLSRISRAASSRGWR